MGRKLGKAALWLLEAAAQELEILYETRSHQRTMILEGREGILRVIEAKERRREYKRIKRLERRKLLALRKEGDRLLCTLTDTGHVTLIKQRAHTTHQRTDGKCLYVLFDIPEHLSHVRRELRRTLRSWGFEMVQRSAWRSDRSLEEPLREWTEMRKFGKWIKILIAEEL